MTTTKIFLLKLVPDVTKVDFMGYRKINIILSLLFLITSIGLVIFKGLNFGIDFTGGTIIELKLNSKPDLSRIRAVVEKLDIGDVNVQNIDVNNVMIRIGNAKSAKEDQMVVITTIKEKLSNNFQDIEFRKIDFVGPQVGKQLIKNGFMAVLFAFIAIMSYVAFRFEWQYGVGIVLALLHDTIFTIGIMSLTDLEFNLTSVAAILTIIGYSVNDSVVIYDRIRENFLKYKKFTVSEIINLSINETLSRTILTVITTLIAVLALILFGGVGMYSFSVVVFFGIIIGTYSSVYVSAPILIYFGLKKFSR